MKEYGLKHGLCKPDDVTSNYNMKVIRELKRKAKIARIYTVKSDCNPECPHIALALPLAGNTPESLRFVTEEWIALVQEVLDTDKKPEWYQIC